MGSQRQSVALELDPSLSEPEDWDTDERRQSQVLHRSRTSGSDGRGPGGHNPEDA